MPSDDAVSAAPGAFRLRWDVFLSFRGEDTRGTITKNIYESLLKHGVRVFLDNDGLNRGDEIAPSLLEAIEDSAACIVVFSPRYADSRWCLEELAKISECRRLILPVFYRVDPSDVRRQRGPFEEHFRIHEERFGVERVLRWRKAMDKVGGIAGFDLWVFRNSEETEKIQSLVKRVLKEINNTPISVAAYTVGIESRVQKLMKILDVKSNGTRILGLHGIGGVGKTTLAKALYNKLAGHFEFRSFISNVREISTDQIDNIGLISLQNKLINDLSGHSVLPEKDVNAEISAITKKVNENRVLIVLDDVDNVSQLNALSGNKDWFHEGSRIIITTRDTKVFPCHLETELYEVRELNWDEALELFSYHAFRKEKPPENFFHLSQEIVSLTGRLPLALEVFGSSLFDKRRIGEWKDAILKLKGIRPLDLQNVLKLSYDGLDEQEKCIFLDIACLFNKMDMKRKHAIDIFKGCGFAAEIAISDLTAKSLIKINKDKTLWMHDQVRDMGRQIVTLENMEDPGMRSRLWDRNEIMSILMDHNHEGEKPIQGIVLDFAKKSSVKDLSSEAISWNKFRRKPNFNSATNYIKQKCKRRLQKQLEKEEDDNDISSSMSIENMSKLRLLQINHVNYRSGKFKSLPSLKWIQWKGCPLKTLPFHFYPPQLAVLDVSESQIQHLGNSKKVAQNLIIINLRECHAIAAIPDLSGHKKLEKLILENCRRLVKIHKSIGSNMNSLICLNLRGCSNLNELPTDVSGLKKLESLILSGCSKVKQLPQNIGTMKALKKLLLDETAISNLPECIFRLSHLEKLSLNRCVQLKRLPCCIGQLVSLKKLSLNGSGLEELPDSIGSLTNLEEISVMWCSSLTILPDSIKNLKSLVEFFVLGSPIEKLPELSVGSLPNLKELSVGKVLYFKELPNSIHYVNSMVVLRIDGTSITSLPDQIGELKLLEKLEMRNCRFLTSLPASIGGLTRLITFIIYEADQITELPESIGMLENLAMLQLTECKKLIELPSSIGSLMSLNRLLMEDTGVTELPESFGMLSSLVFLKMSTMRRHMEREVAVEHAVIPTSFSNLSLLNEFYARGCNISGKIADDFWKLSSLEILDLSYNQISCLPSSLQGMSILKKLLLPHCKYLESLPPLPSSLLELNAANCSALKTISDISKLVRLNQLNLTSCEKVREIPGLECLKSLTRLYMTGCSACSSEVKRILAKGYLRSIRNLSMPGDKIPDWFSQDEVTFSEYKNRAINGVIIGVVVSLNKQITDEMRVEYPAIVHIQAKILKLDYWIYSTTLHLMGVPNTNEEQVHLCRYPPFHPLVSQLKHGYKIQITKRDIPMMSGVELKKIGIYLVYEGDDDYEGDEESLNDNQQSVSEKLAKFFATFSGIN